MKSCTKCLKSDVSFFRNAAKLDGLSTYCKACHTIDTNARKAKNKDRINELNRARRLANPQYFRDATASWVKRNSDKKSALLAKRHASKMERTLKWLDQALLAQIQGFYTAAKMLSQMTGVPHEVDHVVPLQGKNVCGLHLPWNLQVIPAVENQRKGNR